MIKKKYTPIFLFFILKVNDITLTRVKGVVVGGFDWSGLVGVGSMKQGRIVSLATQVSTI